MAVLATELTHKSTGWQHESWWLIYGSGVYVIFVTCATVMLIVFMILYLVILRKGYMLISEDVMKKEAVMSR